MPRDGLNRDGLENCRKRVKEEGLNGASGGCCMRMRSPVYWQERLEVGGWESFSERVNDGKVI